MGVRHDVSLASYVEVNYQVATWSRDTIDSHQGYQASIYEIYLCTALCTAFCTAFCPASYTTPLFGPCSLSSLDSRSRSHTAKHHARTTNASHESPSATGTAKHSRTPLQMAKEPVEAIRLVEPLAPTLSATTPTEVGSCSRSARPSELCRPQRVWRALHGTTGPVKGRLDFPPGYNGWPDVRGLRA
jgi:hypothetical protein